MGELRVVEDRRYERVDARWLRLRCTEPDCVLIEARFVPAASADAFITVATRAHRQLHDEREQSTDSAPERVECTCGRSWVMPHCDLECLIEQPTDTKEPSPDA